MKNICQLQGSIRASLNEYIEDKRYPYKVMRANYVYEEFAFFSQAYAYLLSMSTSKKPRIIWCVEKAPAPR